MLATFNRALYRALFPPLPTGGVVRSSVLLLKIDGKSIVGALIFVAVAEEKNALLPTIHRHNSEDTIACISEKYSRLSILCNTRELPGVLCW